MAENLARAAIENDDVDILREYLINGLIDTNALCFCSNGRRYTAIELSAMLHNYEITEILIHAGADLAKTYEEDSDEAQGPLELAIGARHHRVSVPSPLIDLLLRCGAEVRVGVAGLALIRFWRGISPVEMLLSRFSPVNKHREALEHEHFLFSVAKMPNMVLATKVITDIIQACFNEGCGKCLESRSKTLEDALTAAAANGNSLLVRFLTQYVSNASRALAGAIRGGHSAIIEFLLHTGMSIDFPAAPIGRYHGFKSTPIDPREPKTTPLAEALRTNMYDLIYDLESRGALAHIHEHGRFEAAICAASEAGNSNYVEKLLHMVPDTGEALTAALAASIMKDQDKITWMLLQAGAQVNYVSQGDTFWARLPEPIVEALKRRKKALIYAMLDRMSSIRSFQQSRYTALEEASKWGDFSIIKDLLSIDCHWSTSKCLKAVLNAGNLDLMASLITEYGFPLWSSMPRYHEESLSSNSECDCLLVAVIRSKSIDMLNFLLDSGADPACSQVLMHTLHENKEMFDILLSTFQVRYPDGHKGVGADLLAYAIGKGDDELLDRLLKVKMDVNCLAMGYNRFEDHPQTSSDYKDYKKNALATAMYMHHEEKLDVVRKLLHNRSDPNGIVARPYMFSDNNIWVQKTALLMAVQTKSLPLVELLINAGSDIHRPARLGVRRTPLQQACEVGSMEIVNFLLQRGADVNEAPAIAGGATSLQLCAIEGHIGIAHILLERHADVHAAAAERDGRTALEGAAEWGRLDMIKLIWEVGANEGFSQKECDRAMKLAEGNGHLACRDEIRGLYSNAQSFSELQF